MNIMTKPVIAFFILCLTATAYAQEADEFISVYQGSTIRYDDNIGFEEFSFIVGDATIQTLEGYLRRVFCRSPEGRSPLEIIRNYEKAIQDREGTILFMTREPGAIEIDGMTFPDVFGKNRTARGLATSHYTHTSFPKETTEYLAGKISTDDKDVYVIVAAGPGAWAASEHNRTFFELVTLATEPMKTGMVSVAAIGEGLAAQGRIAIYDIFFDTGKSVVKKESAGALKTVAEYLNQNRDKTYLVVGHTDNTGDFDMNVTLSKNRANAVVAALTAEYGVSGKQLAAHGVGPLAPVSSNATEQGRARNRRVEIVER